MGNASSSLLLFWTLVRAAGVLVLATEALILFARFRDEQRTPSSGAPAAAGAPYVPHAPGARFFWAATPALVLAGLAAWCLTELAPRLPGSGKLPSQHAQLSPR